MPDSPSPHESLRATAVDWCIRLHSGECSEAELQAFKRWHDADPAHAAEYARTSKIWQLSVKVPPLQEAPAMAPARRRSPVRVMARAAAVLLVLGGAWAGGWSVGVLPGNVRYYMAQEDRRQINLPDQSRVELNRRTSLWYLGYRAQRSITLTEGEAYFDVQRDVGKPFLIRTDNAQVRVTGTHFNIWTAPQRTTVTVTQGTVIASPLASDQASELTAGLQAVFVPGQPHQLKRVDPASAAAWRNGRLVLDDASLREALPQINRYLDLPLTLADDGAAELRIGGSYDTAELEQLVSALPHILPVLVRRSGDTLLLSHRPVSAR
ncbi:transmembrane sensor [Pseudomonas taiwanensis]|uniref:FecR family protein n=1 Tax=Pseudomonas taiwanensis TaxID=470150 RepID=UPI0015BDA657|nr:FecR domain-containing protein [Pseudomonas taiwanensis]NWL76635.1 transmembrane sensor [Pseudomonas taiwanensis]